MQLISLSSNQESFNTIHFKPNGISIIAAKQKTTNKKKTYNSVGKSLSIALIHFCLGSNTISDMKKKLKGWTFSLRFKIDTKEYISQRSTESQNEIYLNDDLMSLKEFRQKLEDMLFTIPNNSKHISFRGLISRFIRPNKAAYASYDTPVIAESKSSGGITRQINNSFLLGLDIMRVSEKFELKKNYNEISKLAKAQKKDPIIKSTIRGNDNENIDIKKVELEAKEKRLESNIKTFKLAEDYHQIQKEADELSIKIRSLENKRKLYINAIRNIEKSLKITPDISSETILNFYNNAKIELGDLVKKQLRDVEEFNNKIFSSRIKKLSEEKLKFEKKLSQVDDDIKIEGEKKDAKLKYLNTHGVLDEYVQMNKQLSDIRIAIAKIVDYKKLLKKYEEELITIDLKLNKENISTNQYLDDIQSIIDQNIATFKSFTEQFYENITAGISIENDKGRNLSRFKINATIDHDSGDGVGDVKTFCYDWTLLKMQHNHSIKFIVHDSRITDGLDTRQCSTLFKIAHNETSQNNFQYIIALNQNRIDNLRDELSNDDFNAIIENNIVLELSDESASTKLLGIEVGNLIYNK